MSKRRVFIAINLPEKLKKRLLDYRDQHESLPVRWTKKDSLHLTLVFIGYVTDEEMLEICRVTREVANKNEPFFIKFNKIITGPPGKPARMIWFSGEKNEALTDLINQLQKGLLEVESGFTRPDYRQAGPHITLARARAEGYSKIQAADVDLNFDAEIQVDAIDVMESDLKRDGAEYVVLESCVMGN